MPKVKVYNMEGKQVGDRELREDIFAVKVNPSVVHDVMVALRANARQPLAHTKTRGEVRGGGRKPWKQKGTGRARQGSTRSPIWVGGGITFGPRSERDYTQKINRKTKRTALFMALSDKVADDRLFLVDELASKEGKTKTIASLLSKLPVKGRVMIVSSGKDELLSRSVRNLKTVYLSRVESVSMNDVLGSGFLIFTPESVEAFSALHSKVK